MQASTNGSIKTVAAGLIIPLFALALVVAIHPATSAAYALDTLTFTPEADTYVDSSSPTAGFGAAVSFWVDGSPVKLGLIRFQLSAVEGRTITGARLRLYQTDSAASGGRVWSIASNSWTEATTWSTRPAIDGQQLGAIGAVAQEEWYEVDLAPTAVAGGGPISFAIDSTDPDGARWSSREGGHPPELAIDLAPATGDRFAFTPEADTYVDASQPNSSFASTPSLWVDGNPIKQAFFRFHIAGLAGRTILAAHLRMHQLDASPIGGKVFAISSTTWPESVTWNSRPAIDGSLLASFQTVSSGNWYQLDLNRVDLFPVDGLVALAIQSPNGDGAKWKTRESEFPPQLILDVTPASGLILDGLTQVATPYQGSLQPTSYASNHRVALTSNGRLLATYGVHNTGIQLTWRDKAGGWMVTSTGDVADGVIDRNGMSGDRPASIAVGRDPSGEEHAWVVWSGPTGAQGEVDLRRLSNLDSAEGPTVGPLVTLVPLGLGNTRADVALEVASDGTLRGCVVWTPQVDDSTWQLVTGWFTDLATDTPALQSTTVITSADNNARVGTLTPSVNGMRLVARAAGGKMQLFGHDQSAPLATWWTGKAGVTTSSYVYPSAVALSTGEILGAVESKTQSHTVTVQRFSANGAAVTTELQLTGYSQPTIATDGANAWLVMIRSGDGFLISRALTAGAGWDPADRVEIGAEGGGNLAWPNLVRETDGRLRLLVRGPAGGTFQDAVLAYQRPL